MNSYIELTNGEKIYVAEISGKKCTTFSGFMKELIGSFNLSSDTPLNINAITGYILSSWLGYKKIIIVGINVLKKEKSHYDEIMKILNDYKTFWENKNPKNKFVIID